jgi:hypothetical protein
VDGPLKAKLPLQRPKLPEVQMQGTLVPKLISSHTDVNYVLTQQPGKLRTQDIKVGQDTHIAIFVRDGSGAQSLGSTT